MTTTPMVSILLPSYNYAAYLGEAIESVLRQTYTDFELLILDDGSEDDSVAVAQCYAEADPRVIVWRQENSGVATTLNQLYERARGAFIAQLGSDDIWLPNRLALGVKSLERDPTLSAVFCSFFVIDGEGAPLPNISHFSLGTLEGEELLAKLVVQNCLCACTALIRREAMHSEVFSRELTLVQDWDLWLRLGRQGKLRLEREAGALYRWHGQNLTTQQPKRSLLEHREVYEKVALPLARLRSRKILCESIEKLANICWQLGDRGATARYLKEVKELRSLTADEQICYLLGLVSLRAHQDIKRALHEAQSASVQYMPAHYKILREIAARI